MKIVILGAILCCGVRFAPDAIVLAKIKKLDLTNPAEIIAKSLHFDLKFSFNL